MPAKKFYAVKAGREKGIFLSWEVCRKSVDGFPNALYKSFPTMEQANDYLHNDVIHTEITQNSTENDPDEVIAYIDGSYDDMVKRFSYAAILFVDGEKITYSNSEDNFDIVKLRNVAGELKAAMYAMQFTEKQGKKKLKLYYDYAGIEMWATNQWKTNLHFTQIYASYVKKISEKINITFVKVKSHSGNLYNDEVDQLAKMALLKDNHSPDITPSVSQITEMASIQQKNVLSSLRGNRTTLNLYLLPKQGSVINSEDILKLVKLKWKASKKSLKDIQEIKAYYDIEAEIFVIGISTKQGEYIIYTFRSDEWNG